MHVLQLPRVVMAVKDEAPSKSFEPLQVQSYNSSLARLERLVELMVS